MTATRFCRLVALVVAVLLLGGCGSWDPKQSSGTEYRQTKDGYYRVRTGDSLHAIAFRFDLDWRDIAAWNGIRSPYVIYPDQELRLTAPPPRTSPASVSVAPARTPGSVTTRDAPAAARATEPASTPSQTPETQPEVAASAPPPEPTDPPRSQVPARQQPSSAAVASVPEPGQWTWPADGRLLSRFKSGDPSRNGIDIAGTEGQPVRAAAGGEVVYSGNGLISYGELIIIKHSDRVLSAYGHNRARLVKEGDVVRAGQTIAEMGRNDRNQAVLHFEVRVNGTPQDPLKYLPRR
jgi:lipoprotein NlpD